jgi:O-antigen/teichoic acid export membrane protein
MVNYSRKLKIGLSWMSALRVFKMLLDFISKTILAFILLPTDFGLFALSMGINYILSSATKPAWQIALVQNTQVVKGELDDIVNAIYSINIIKGFLLTILLFNSANYIASIYKVDDLAFMIQIMSFTFLISGFKNPQQFRELRKVKFKKNVFIEAIPFFSFTVSAVFLSYLLRDASAMAYAALIQSLVYVITSNLLFEQRAKITLKLNKVYVIFKFGMHVMLHRLIEAFSNQIIILLIGFFSGSSILGVFVFVKGVTIRIYEEFGILIESIFFPYLCRVDNKIEKLIRLTLVVLSISLLLGVILYFVVPMYLTAIGERWSVSEEIIILLILVGIFTPIKKILLNSYMRSIGSANIPLNFDLVKILLLSIIIILFEVRYIERILVIQVYIELLIFLTSIYIVYKMNKIK